MLTQQVWNVQRLKLLHDVELSAGAVQLGERVELLKQAQEHVLGVLQNDIEKRRHSKSSLLGILVPVTNLTKKLE